MIRTIYFLLILFSCSFDQQQRIESINSDKLISLQAEGVTVVDIRTQNEYNQGHIPGVLHIDYSAPDFMDRMKRLNLDEPVIIHCASGGRSSKASNLLKSAGFLTVYDYSGGFSDWKSKGLSIE